jgi:hypothetical protein
MKPQRIPFVIVGILGILGIAVVALRLQQFLAKRKTEAFEDVLEAEDRVTPEAFAYNLLQAVKGPIQRLSSTLINKNVWVERFELAKMSPVELARHYQTLRVAT